MLNSRPRAKVSTSVIPAIIANPVGTSTHHTSPMPYTRDPVDPPTISNGATKKIVNVKNKPTSNPQTKRCFQLGL